MNKIATAIVILLGVSYAFAQPYGNEWIDYNKQYYKVGLNEDGIYRLTYSDLVAAGFPVNSVDPRRLQMFYKGNEIAIRVTGQNDAVFNTGDYIEFYGRKNDGESDAGLYQPQEAQPHQYYNIYSDSSAYFLTFDLATADGERMTIFDENNTGLTALPFHSEKLLHLNVSHYSAGRGYNTDEFSKFTYFDYGEGWTSSVIQEGRTYDNELTGITNVVNVGANPQLEVLMVGRDYFDHEVNVLVGPNSASLRQVGSIIFKDFDTGILTTEIEWSDISAMGELVVRVSVVNDGDNDLVSCSYVKLDYPQAFDMENQNEMMFHIPAQSTTRAYVEISNVPTNTELYDVTDHDNVYRLGSTSSGSDINAVLNNTTTARTIIANGTGFKTPSISKIRFKNIDPNDHDYIIISNKYLRKSVDGIEDPVIAYAQYRASQSGGGYDTLIMDMEMLSNQFSYGLSGPLAVYDFLKYLYQNGNPQYVFIIGKGLEPSANFYRNANGVFDISIDGNNYEIRDLVPAAGAPGADIAYTSGLDGGYGPAIPIGRLPARQPKHVLNYLEKVRYMDQLPFDDLWRKRILHLSGGLREYELPIFRSYMDGFAAIATDDYLGGKVTTVAKSSGSVSQFINVADEVNNGLNLITFYGHSSPGVTDIDIGFVTNPENGYDNEGKYNTILVNGCNAGQFFNVDVIFGEDWVLAEDKGAIGFIAHSSFGFTSGLRRYSDLFYSYAYGDSVFISEPIADVQDKVAEEYMEISPATPTNIVQVQQMVLLGDPVMRVFGAEKPDYELTSSNIYIESFDGEPVNAQSDSFAIKSIVKNYGRTGKDSLHVSVSRTLADNTILTYDSIFPSVDFIDTLTMTVRLGSESNFGSNTFRVTIDSKFQIEELDEANNSGVINFFIPLYGTQNLMPQNFGIVNDRSIEFIAQSTNLLEGERVFLFELDTISDFSSSYLQSNSVTSRTLSRWRVNLLPDVAPNDSMVYYWRTRYANLSSGESDEWVKSSFTYINNGEEGWSQSDTSQLLSNGTTGLEFNAENNYWQFLRTSREVEVTTYGANNAATNTDVSVRIDGLEYIVTGVTNRRPCADNTLNFIVFDKNSADPIPFVGNNRLCGRQPLIISSFSVSDLQGAVPEFSTFIQNINEGDSVLAFSIGDVSPSVWNETTKGLLEEIGLGRTAIENVNNGEPIIFFGRKGDAPGDTNLLTATTDPKDEQTLQADFLFTGVSDTGEIRSVTIGPSVNWDQLIFEIDKDATDAISIDIIGIDLNGQETLLFADATTSPVDLSSISLPYLRLELRVSDEVNLDPGQLQKWLVTYTPAPEGVLLPVNDETRIRQEGEAINELFYFTNISDQVFQDSLTVFQSIFNQESRSEKLGDFKIRPPAPGDSTEFEISINSLGITGLNDLTVSVNPRLLPELYYDNNLINYREFLEIKADQIDPFIEVLFDGRRIVNGDIVSPSPLITVRVQDENPYLLITDTTSVKLFLKKANCEECNYDPINFSDPNVSWSAADSDSDFTIEYKPEMLEDGVYSLRITAEDQSGNQSGEEPYIISFEVVNEAAITNFYPYPNPFSSSTRFVFTLTGSDIPEEIMIQVLTVSGKVVREITQDEIGPIHIGNNITQYAWDGRDEFGDKLANGVYLYRVKVQMAGEQMNRRNTSADRAFKNGFGKLYILR